MLPLHEVTILVIINLQDVQNKQTIFFFSIPYSESFG
jgi:hypothetical protein